MVAERGFKSTKRTHFVHQLRKKFVNGRPIRKFTFHERPTLHERTVRRLKVPKIELIAKRKPAELDHDILNITEDIDLPIPRESSRLSERGHLLHLGTLKPLISEQTLSTVAEPSPIGSINTVKRIVRERVKPPVGRELKSIGVQATPSDRVNRATQTSLSFNLPAILRGQYGVLDKTRDHQLTISCHEFLQHIQTIYDSPCSVANQTPQSIASLERIRSNYSNITSGTNQPIASFNPIVRPPDKSINPPLSSLQIVQRPIVNYYTTNPPNELKNNNINSTNSSQPNNHPYAGLTRNQIKRIKYLNRKSKKIQLGNPNI